MLNISTQKKRILVTSALPYINGIKHLGNLIGSMLPADCYTRFMRYCGHDVVYICATDEHGTPAELAAAEKGLKVEDYCKEMHEVQKKLGEGFNLSWNYFGRSSSPQNHKLTQYFFDCLDKAGLIEERVTKQVYSIDDKRFLPDRYVVGTCPHCGYDKARGDQCESCTRVLDPTDLLNPHSAISGSNKIEIRDSKHLFLLQSKMVDVLKDWVSEKEKQGLPHLVTSIARKWLDEGLHDRCITRDLEWGVPVHKEGFEGKVFYVWFDAPIEYIAATKEWTDSQGLDDSAWQSWWKSDDVYYVEFMAKDNIPFHTVSFPITILGTNKSQSENWKLVDYIKGFNWLNYYGGKFSTSQKRGVFMNHALDILPSDYWRWYLLSNAPEGSDFSFTWEGLQTAVNKDLADVFGNLVNRIMKFTQSKYGAIIPSQGKFSDLEIQYFSKFIEKQQNYMQFMQDIEIRKAASELRSMWVLCNEYLQEAAAWTVYKTDTDRAAAICRFALNLVAYCAAYAMPFIPNTAQKVLNCFNVKVEDCYINSLDLTKSLLVNEQSFTLPDILFSKIEDSQRDEWIAQFSGV